MTNKNKCLIILVLTIVFLIIFNIKIKTDNKIFKDYFNNKQVYIINDYQDKKDLLTNSNISKDENIIITDIKKLKLGSAKRWDYDIDIINKNVNTSYNIKPNDNIEMYWINKTGKVYITKYDSVIDLPKDEYALYIKINNNIYNTNKIYIF